MTEPRLPQLDAPVFLTDGGLETTLIFDDGFDLPDFAAFTLLDAPEGREALTRYFESYVAIAARDSVGIVLETADLARQPGLGRSSGLRHRGPRADQPGGGGAARGHPGAVPDAVDAGRHLRLHRAPRRRLPTGSS